MLYILIGLLILLVAFMILMVGFIKYSPKGRAVDDRTQYYQEQAKVGQGIMQGALNRAQLRRDTRTQEAANYASQVAAQGIRIQTDTDRAQLERDNVFKEAELSDAKHALAIATTRAQLKEQQLREKLIDLAYANGYDLDTYLAIQRKQHLDELDIRKLEQDVMTKLRGGFVYQLRGYQKLAMLRDQLDALYERAYQIKASRDPKPVKERKLRQVEEDIRLLEEDARGRRQGLLQAYNGENAEGGDPDTDD
jgi:hypothetical protein